MGSIMGAWIIAGLGFAMAWQAKAITSFQKCAPGLEDQVNLLHQVVAVGMENRRTFEEFAADEKVPLPEVRAKFAATGRMECSGLTGTVQVVNTGTGPSKLVPTAGHLFYDANCERKKSMADCKIIFPNSGSREVFRINEKTIKTGGCPKRDKKLDWALFELNKELPGVVPYAIPPKDPPPYVTPGMDVVTVSGGSNNFVRNGMEPPHIAGCKIRDRFRFANYPLQSDCNTGGGSSGAGQLTWSNNRPTLAALHLGGAGNMPPGSPYNRDSYFNASIPLEGEFLAAIHQALGTR
jgi:hypothetical protein